MAGSLTEAHRARNNGFENHVTEVFLDFANDLLREVVAHVHGHQDPADVQVRIGAALPDLIHDGINLGEAFQGEILALNRHKQLIGC